MRFRLRSQRLWPAALADARRRNRLDVDLSCPGTMQKHDQKPENKIGMD